MKTLRIWVTVLFMMGWMLSAATRADPEPALDKIDQSVWDGKFKLKDVKTTKRQTMWALALPSERAKVTTFFGYYGIELCSYLTNDVKNQIADWDLRLVATAVMNAEKTAFEAKSLISSIDDAPLVSTVTDKCPQLTKGEQTNEGQNPLLIVTNHFVPGKDADFALWTDNALVLRELGAGWVDLGTQSDGKWTKKRFDWPKGKATPQVGDWIKATQRNHLYADYLRHRKDLDVWVGGPTVTVINGGDRFYVDAVKELREGNVWAKIRPPVGSR